MVDGAFLPDGSVIFGQRAPLHPFLLASSRALGRIARYQSSMGMIREARFHKAKCKIWRGTISIWNFPYQLLQKAPFPPADTCPYC